MSYSCGECGKEFSLPASVLARFPNWTPRQCMECRGGQRGAAPEKLDRSQVLARFTAGPQTGVFTDGCCEPNPGPGGWGAVKVVDGQIVEERHGSENPTTNNRMELIALIEGYKLLGEDEDLPVFSDSEYCIKTIKQWAESWKNNDWRRGKQRDPIKNLELVQELYALAKSRPLAKPEWIRGHAGSRWNEYADALSRVYQTSPGDEPPTSSI